MTPYHLIFYKPEMFNDYFLGDDSESILYLPKANSINVIIGANNSGKSRFMRCLMSNDDFIYINCDLFDRYNALINEYNERAQAKAHTYRSEYALVNIKLNVDVEKIIYENAQKLNVNRFSFESSFRGELSNFVSKLIINLKKIKSHYIPTLRTAHSLYQGNHDRIDDDIFLFTLDHYYKINKNVKVFTGMNFYEEILNSRNSEKSIRNRFEEFEKFLGKNFFENKQIDIVANFSKNDNKQGKSSSELILIYVEGEINTRKLHDLGDGIQAIIILMYKIFMAEPKSFIYIDEPELNLHPGMQRLFLEQISSNPELKKKEITYVISTHSNHFLDLTIEKENVSIYSFAPKDMGGEKQFIIKNVNIGDNSLLKHLGVNNSSVFMANCSIWVEGISDRNYIKAFLKSYIKHLIETKSSRYKFITEDIDYAFFEYAGSNIEHYIFENEINEDEESLIIKEINALALNNKIFLLADSDNVDNRSAKDIRLRKLEMIKNDKFQAKIIREFREIENLLTNNVWIKVLSNFCDKNLMKKYKLEIEEKIEHALTKVNANDFKKDYIGKFLNSVNLKIGKLNDKNILNKIYEKKGTSYGTLIHKRELSEYVLKEDFSWNVFAENEEIVKLTEEVYQFILDSMN